MSSSKKKKDISLSAVADRTYNIVSSFSAQTLIVVASTLLGIFVKKKKAYSPHFTPLTNATRKKRSFKDKRNWHVVRCKTEKNLPPRLSLLLLASLQLRARASPLIFAAPLISSVATVSLASDHPAGNPPFFSLSLLPFFCNSHAKLAMSLTLILFSPLATTTILLLLLLLHAKEAWMRKRKIAALIDTFCHTFNGTTRRRQGTSIQFEILRLCATHMYIATLFFFSFFFLSLRWRIHSTA